MTPFALAADLVDRACAARPWRATFIGVAGHDHRWDDRRAEGDAVGSALVDASSVAFAAVPPTGCCSRSVTAV